MTTKQRQRRGFSVGEWFFEKVHLYAREGHIRTIGYEGHHPDRKTTLHVLQPTAESGWWALGMEDVEGIVTAEGHPVTRLFGSPEQAAKTAVAEAVRVEPGVLPTTYQIWWRADPLDPWVAYEGGLLTPAAAWSRVDHYRTAKVMATAYPKAEYVVIEVNSRQVGSR